MRVASRPSGCRVNSTTIGSPSAMCSRRWPGVQSTLGSTRKWYSWPPAARRAWGHGRLAFGGDAEELAHQLVQPRAAGRIDDLDIVVVDVGRRVALPFAPAAGAGMGLHRQPGGARERRLRQGQPDL